MKTQVQSFCNEVNRSLTPFNDRLDGAIAELGGAGEAALLDDTLSSLRGLRHRAATLREKLDESTSFVVVFGPLKNGKSTFVNALAGSYLSDISSIPSYPAVAYLKHGAEEQFQTTTYSGKWTDYESREAMLEALDGEHESLIERYLERRKKGQALDPSADLPEAIQRLDIDAPSRSLAEAGSVVVEIPGLCEAMGIGYRLEQADFEGVATCAVFVVKPESLFSERVFEDFSELLGRFEKVFLVANLDTAKHDVDAKGALRPTTESRDPKRYLEAVEKLSTSPSLREALRDERLSICTVDLLRAAADRLCGWDESVEGSAVEVAAVESEGEPDFSREPFSRLLRDLAASLDTCASLRLHMSECQGAVADLARQTLKVARREADENQSAASTRLAKRLDEVNGQLKSIETLDSIDWDRVFAEPLMEKEKLLAKLSEQYFMPLSDGLEHLLDEWLETDESLRALQDDRLNARIHEETKDDAASIIKFVMTLLENQTGGADFTAPQKKALGVAGIDVSKLVPDLLAKLGRYAQPLVHRISIDLSQIPIKRGPADYSLARSKLKSRMAFFGEKADEPIPVAKKKKRLEGEGSDLLRKAITQYPSTELFALNLDHVNGALNGYTSGFAQAVLEAVSDFRAHLNETKSKLEAHIRFNRKVTEIAESIAEASAKLESEMAEAKRRYRVEETEAARSDGHKAKPKRTKYAGA